MIKSLKEFHCYVGETIMFCQCIEHDIKWIYAGMLNGDFDGNYESIKEWTLGKTVSELQNLDNSDGKPYLHKKDYELLRQIVKIRNHWVHTAYTCFIYEHDFENSQDFNKQANRLENDNGRLSKLSDTIEKVRLDMLKDYGRI